MKPTLRIIGNIFASAREAFTKIKQQHPLFYASLSDEPILGLVSACAFTGHRDCWGSQPANRGVARGIDLAGRRWRSGGNSCIGCFVTPSVLRKEKFPVNDLD